ncbi:MAG: glycosyltransferase family 2 protein [Candidatus Omnitrophica bacterium]|nr:glycosyltransferase family 2 protein [Candidatus Omnitrophota bacterium]
MPTKPELSILIPIYNASTILPMHVRKLLDYLNRTPYAFEVLLRDDKSTDHSLEQLKEFVHKDQRVKVFHNTCNRGLGYTLNRLIGAAQGKTLVYCDIDFPYSWKTMDDILRQVKTFDVVVASRYLEAAHGHVQWYRKLASRMYYLLCRALFRVQVQDIGSGLVAFNEKTKERVHTRARGFDFHVEFFARARRQGLSVKEIPGEISEHNQMHSFLIWQHGPGVLFRTIQLWVKLFDESPLS